MENSPLSPSPKAAIHRTIKGRVECHSLEVVHRGLKTGFKGLMRVQYGIDTLDTVLSQWVSVA